MIKSVKDAITGNISMRNIYRYRGAYGYFYENYTKLYYLQTRFYDPSIGRFLNADDTDYLNASGTTLGCNLYAYCENNCINKVDPEGNIAGVDDATILFFGALCVLVIGLFATVSTPGFRSAWQSYCIRVKNGLSHIASTISNRWRTVKYWTKSAFGNALAALSAFATIVKAMTKVIANVKQARKNTYRYFEISFVNDIPILGAPLNRQGAVSKIRQGKSVITFYKSDALYISNSAGRARSICDNRHGGAGFFHHFHLVGRSNRSHSFYIANG